MEGHSKPPLGLGTNIVNLSDYILNSAELGLLSKGFKFIPTPKTHKVKDIHESISELGRKIKIQYAVDRLNIQSTHVPFTEKGKWTPSSALIHPDLLTHLEELHSLKHSIVKYQESPNLTPFEISALENLKNRTDIVLKPADKGGQVVIMDRKDYVYEGLRQLSINHHYQELEAPIFEATKVKIQEILADLKRRKFISEKQHKYLSPPEISRERRFYLLPKIHKPLEKWTVPNKIPPGRPIVSDCNSESYKVSELIDYYLKPLATEHPSYLKDTQDFINKIRHLTLPEDCLLVTMDVESLYTNIDNKAGLTAVKEKMLSAQNRDIPIDQIIQLLDLCLSNNDFEFDGKFYLQIHGTAMGKLFAPNYANIFMAKWETEALARSPVQPTIYLRFLDDIFVIWQHGEKAFWDFFEILNSHTNSIKLKATISHTSIDFLDVTVFKSEIFNHTRTLDTKVYFKPTDTHDLLHKSSYHPKHTFKGILKSQIIRFYRISSRENDFDKACSTLFASLITRGYSKRFLRTIKNNTIQELKFKNSIIHGVETCGGQRCQCCQYIIQGDKIDLKHRSVSCIGQLDCNSENIIYLIKCTKCDIGYVGETGNALRIRLNQHMSDIRLHKQTAIAEHFNSEQHSLQHFKIMPIEKVAENKNANFRKLQESKWIDQLQTLKPLGLNQKKDRCPNEMLPFVVPYNKTSSQIVRKVKPIYDEMVEKFPSILPHKLVTAFKRNNNLKDALTHSKLKPLP